MALDVVRLASLSPVSMFASKVYFSLTEILDPAHHRTHNEWHQLDHRPENLLLPGVAWGDRWVRSPDCAQASAGLAPEYARTHYAIMYWFREPLRPTLDQFFALSEFSFQWGRSPQIGWTKRPLRGFFSPVKGYVAARVRVSVDALPRRPVRGIHVTISRLRRHDALAHEAFRWYDEVRIPDLLQCRGAAGAWTFASDDLFPPPWEESTPAWSFADSGSRLAAASPLRMTIMYLDEDPLEYLADVAERDAAWRASGRVRDTSSIEDVFFASPFRMIVPWEWNWFDTVRAAS